MAHRGPPRPPLIPSRCGKVLHTAGGMRGVQHRGRLTVTAPCRVVAPPPSTHGAPMTPSHWWPSDRVKPRRPADPGQELGGDVDSGQRGQRTSTNASSSRERRRRTNISGQCEPVNGTRRGSRRARSQPSQSGVVTAPQHGHTFDTRWELADFRRWRLPHIHDLPPLSVVSMAPSARHHTDSNDPARSTPAPGARGPLPRRLLGPRRIQRRRTR